MRIGQGIGIGIKKHNGLVEPETVSLIDRMTVKPTPDRVKVVNDTIVALKDEGIWDYLDVIYFTAAHDSQAAILNWKADNHNLIPVNNPTFTTDVGVNSDGTSSYLYSDYRMNTETSLTTHIDCAFGAYITNRISSAPSSTLIWFDSINHIIPSNPDIGSTDIYTVRINYPANQNVFGMQSEGAEALYSTRRNGNGIFVYKSGLVRKTNSLSPNSTSETGELYILAKDNTPSPTGYYIPEGKLKFAFAGTSAIDHSKLNNILISYLNSIGS